MATSGNANAKRRILGEVAPLSWQEALGAIEVMEVPLECGPKPMWGCALIFQQRSALWA
jgi:hypothetical protein